MTKPRCLRLARLASVLGTLALAGASQAQAAEVDLAPRHRSGDSYALSLRAGRDTDASWKGRERNAFAEQVQLDYTATVVVLEVDAVGRVIRERHDGVRLTATRPDGSASLFRDGASFELRRDDNDLQVFAGEERIDRKTEKLVAGLLATRFEHGTGPALFDPGRPVEIGESWPLDPTLARRFLRERGVRVVALEGPPTATLERVAGADGQDALVIRYAIPVARFEADELPAHARSTKSEALIEGEIPLAGEAGASGHAMRLALTMNGVVQAPGFAYATPWRFESARRSDERTQILRGAYASGH